MARRKTRAEARDHFQLPSPDLVYQLEDPLAVTTSPSSTPSPPTNERERDILSLSYSLSPQLLSLRYMPKDIGPGRCTDPELCHRRQYFRYPPYTPWFDAHVKTCCICSGVKAHEDAEGLIVHLRDRWPLPFAREIVQKHGFEKVRACAIEVERNPAVKDRASFLANVLRRRW